MTGVEEKEGYVEVRVEGPFASSHVAAILEEVARAADRVEGRRVLVNFLGVTGRAPTTTERYQLGAAAGRLPPGTRIATLARPEFVDPERFGQRVAQNRGADLEVFEELRAALDWLLAKS